MSFLSKTLQSIGTNLPFDIKLLRSSDRPLKGLTTRQLLKLESEIGAQIFGPTEKNLVREFFCLDEKTWIWHEQWLDRKRNLVSRTVRYEIQDKGILKIQDGGKYDYLAGEELNNLILAIGLYYERVMRELYKVDPSSGKSLV